MFCFPVLVGHRHLFDLPVACLWYAAPACSPMGSLVCSKLFCVWFPGKKYLSSAVNDLSSSESSRNVSDILPFICKLSNYATYLGEGKSQPLANGLFQLMSQCCIIWHLHLGNMVESFYLGLPFSLRFPYWYFLMVQHGHQQLTCFSLLYMRPT